MPIHSIRRVALNLALAAILGFGAFQALARPATAAVPLCSPSGCDRGCRANGAMYGDCVPDPVYPWEEVCQCAYP